MAASSNASTSNSAQPPTTPPDAALPPGGPPTTAIERDTILIVGRRASGKTVYIAVLYALLWNRLKGVTMKALSGRIHTFLDGINSELLAGAWPSPTNLNVQELELEITDGDKKRLLIALEYGGEVFHRAFLEERHDDSECQRLRGFVDRALALIILLDPSAAIKAEHDARVDDQFGMVQVVSRIRNWPGGNNVPITIALTKSDLTGGLIADAGGTVPFVTKHYAALARTMRKVQIYQVSAFQQTTLPDGSIVPDRASKPINVEAPLVYCLNEIRMHETQRQQRAARTAAEKELADALHAEEQYFRRQNRRFWLCFWLLTVLGFAGALSIPFWIGYFQ